MRKLVIDRAAIKNNLTVIKDRAAGAAIYGVVTGDGQGVGAAALAQLLRDEGIGRFAVSEIAEAEALRQAGFVDEEILMLRATTDREELERLVDLNVVCTVSSVDTGMGFGGFLVSEPEKLLLAYRSMPNVALSGVYTQLHAVRPNDPQAKRQLEQFQQALDAIHDAGFETGVVHAAGSFALLHGLTPELDGVRAGSAVLGRCRRTRDDGLKTVGFGQAPLTEVRWLPKGHVLGVDRPVTLKKPTRVAVLPVGYQNGFGVTRPRETGLLAAIARWRKNNRRTVRLGSQRARVLGGLGASELILDVTDLKCSVGDLATFEMDPLFARGFQVEFR